MRVTGDIVVSIDATASANAGKSKAKSKKPTQQVNRCEVIVSESLAARIVDKVPGCLAFERLDSKHYVTFEGDAETVLGAIDEFVHQHSSGVYYSASLPRGYMWI